MFYVYNKRTFKKVKIYSVSEGCNLNFLIRENKQWTWENAKEFITEEEYEDICKVEPKLITFDEAVKNISMIMKNINK